MVKRIERNRGNFSLLKELQRRLGVTYKTAWRMAGLIREHMATVDGDEVVTKVVANAKRASLLPHINAHIAKGSLVSTDELKSYNSLPDHGFRHITVNHGADQYVGTIGREYEQH